MERIQDLVYTHVQGGQFRWVTVSTLMSHWARYCIGESMVVVNAELDYRWHHGYFYWSTSLSQTFGLSVAVLFDGLSSGRAFWQNYCRV